MATPHFASAVKEAHAADTEFLVRRGMSKGYQWMSLLTPPAYAAFVLSQRGRAAFSVNRLLRATWLGGASGASCSYASVLVLRGLEQVWWEAAR
jgi:hypothetical protein